MRPWTSVAVVTLLAAGAASAAPAPPRDACFRSSDYQDFRPVDDHSFNVRTNGGGYFHIETQGACPALTYPQPVLIMQVRGSDMICGPLDWDLRIGQSGGGGFATPCIVKSQTRLTPNEVAAIPKGQKP